MIEPRKLQKPFPDDFCLLCGGPPAMVGIFVPKDPESWGATKGKTRILRYCLCAKCSKGGDVQGRVEKIIRAELTGGGSRC